MTEVTDAGTPGKRCGWRMSHGGALSILCNLEMGHEGNHAFLAKVVEPKDNAELLKLYQRWLSEERERMLREFDSIQIGELKDGVLHLFPIVDRKPGLILIQGAVK